MIIQPTKIIPLLGIGHGMTILDIGSSIGFWSKQIAEIVGMQGKVIAVDNHTEIIQRLNHDIKEFGLTNIHAITGDIHKLSEFPVKKESCDKVLVIRMLSIIEDSLEQKVLGLVEFTKENGNVIIIDAMHYKHEIEAILEKHSEHVIYNDIPEVTERTDDYFFGISIGRAHIN
jgi:ubiquinone/menaquinone biosynthesis C-methylase UbiE